MMIKCLSFSSEAQPKYILHIGQGFIFSFVNFLYISFLQTVFKFINNKNQILYLEYTWYKKEIQHWCSPYALANIFLNWESKIPKSKITHVMPRINILYIYAKQKQIKDLTIFPKTKAYLCEDDIQKISLCFWIAQLSLVAANQIYLVDKSPLCSHHSHPFPLPFSVSPCCPICLFVSHSLPLYKQNFFFFSVSLLDIFLTQIGEFWMLSINAWKEPFWLNKIEHNKKLFSWLCRPLL